MFCWEVAASSTQAFSRRRRGLDLVRACADGWGRHPYATSGDTGKYVWCELGAA